MLRKLLLITMAIGMAACAPAPAPAPAPVDTSADEARLKADLQRWFADFTAGNFDAVAAQYMEDAIAMPPNEPAVVGRAAIKESFAKMAAGLKAGNLDFKFTGVTGVGVSGDMGWLSGTYAVTDVKGVNIDVGKYVSVHKKVNGALLYVRDIWNSDMVPPPTPPPPPAPKKK